MSNAGLAQPGQSLDIDQRLIFSPGQPDQPVKVQAGQATILRSDLTRADILPFSFCVEHRPVRLQKQNEKKRKRKIPSPEEPKKKKKVDGKPSSTTKTN